MASFGKVLKQLQDERRRIQAELRRIDEAIGALRKLAGPNHVRLGRGKGPRGPRRLSLAARKRIAAAQKARWAKVKAQKKA